MCLKNIMFLFLILFIVINRADSKLLLTVYYESRCPDSQSFIQQQLRPAMRQLHEHVKMLFVPFGKATSIDYGSGGFECQHGYRECYWNMVQDCTIHLMQGRPDLDILDYVACEMNYKNKRGFQCSEKAGVSSDRVQQCLDFDLGTMLQLTSEYKTSIVQPKFIPTITINNEFDQTVQNSAMSDLEETLCSFLNHTYACKEFYNRKALKHFVLVSPQMPPSRKGHFDNFVAL